MIAYEHGQTNPIASPLNHKCWCESSLISCPVPSHQERTCKTIQKLGHKSLLTKPLLSKHLHVFGDFGAPSETYSFTILTRSQFTMVAMVSEITLK